MKISYQTILRTIPALKELAKAKMTGTAALRVARALKLLSVEAQTYHEARLALAKSLGTLTDDGQNYLFADQGVEFNAQLVKMLHEELDIDLPQLSESDLDLVDIAPEHLLPLLGVLING